MYLLIIIILPQGQLLIHDSTLFFILWLLYLLSIPFFEVLENVFYEKPSKSSLLVLTRQYFANTFMNHNYTQKGKDSYTQA